MPIPNTNTGVWWNTELNASQKLCKSIYYAYYSHVLREFNLKLNLDYFNLNI